jgi:beta-glucosidase
MGWEIMPDDFTAVLTRVSHDYPSVPIFVTENGWYRGTIQRVRRTP